MMTCVHAMQTLIMSFHLIPRWHEWNMNANDIMMTWFALFVNLVMSHLTCVLHVCMHGTCTLNKYGVPKYLSDLVSMQADSNLGKLTASHFGVLNTCNANKNIPNMIPIAYLNKNLMNCNENLAWGN